MKFFKLFSAFMLAGILSGCYSHRPSMGAGQTSFHPPRRIDPRNIAVPAGYRIEVVANGLTFPTGITFDEDGTPVVVESGYAYGEKWTTPRLVRVEPDGSLVPVASGGMNGPWNGVSFDHGNFYVAEGGEREGGRILKISSDGQVTMLISNLPSLGDHHTDGPVIGPDGKIYFGQGTASNAGIVGPDNMKFGWLARHPEFHDIPGQDITLTGQNITSPDVLRGHGRARTGAFVPFGTRTFPGQVIPGGLPCNGSVMAISPDGGDLQLVAWGFRNPFGLAFDPNGKLFVTDNGYDDRGSRPVWGVSDLLWSVNQGTWYGWPDFTGNDSLSDKAYQPPHKKRIWPLIADPPNVPPAPVAHLGVHVGAAGLDFSRSEQFGHVGEAFVALFGDEAPNVGKTLHPVGCRVVRVNVKEGIIEDFAVNFGRHNGPASKIGGGGLERPIAVRFSPDGNALYVVDFGVMTENHRGDHPRTGTGVLWRITWEGPE